MPPHRRRLIAYRRQHRPWLRLGLWSALLLAATSCGSGTDSTDASNPTGQLPSESDVVADLQWPATEGAFEYRVRAWAGQRLLFEERTAHARLSSTPTLERALAFFPTATLSVQPLDAAGEPLGSEIEVAVSAARAAREATEAPEAAP